jgi:hypothetical protein
VFLLENVEKLFITSLNCSLLIREKRLFCLQPAPLPTQSAQIFVVQTTAKRYFSSAWKTKKRRFRALNSLELNSNRPSNGPKRQIGPEKIREFRPENG